MDNAVLPSTLLLTLLLIVGQVFFIRASTKDRTEKAQLVSTQEETILLPLIKEYFQSRYYRVAEVDPEQNQVTFEGFVRPSLFLAAFLTLLAFVGCLCLALVLSQLLPNFGFASLGLLLLSPLSGLFYWKKAGRLEKVVLKVESSASNPDFSSCITVVAHRDELNELQQALQLKIA
ncbi:cofactor assembly of complex C subunit B [Calothrix sp. UHCC 0171]|uniref:cofactor assembly of complex C subunit B n=1 Tax=Calothrix sp. UHCC 0171 TaxID=3110245 RepID=UPI002B210FFC|nr:cofactor assembly of complex C subunit B [Calothrix sp. UHCC 0171]MEA5570476.1 cofactor assembly of complex C subunit B [Calothrix sp. UHCC 0171]